MATEGKPVKGILKHTSSLDKHDNPQAHGHDGKRHGMTWDEMNILATHHPPDKDYGHMKIDEPPTPYSKYSDPEEDEDGETERRGSIGKQGAFDPSEIAAKLEESQEDEERSRHVSTEGESEEEDEDDLKYETTDEKEHRHAFELKRKIHYNEFQAVQLAKKLLAEEDDEEEEDDKQETEAMDSNSSEVKPDSSLTQ